MTKVRIDTPGAKVEIEADEPLETLKLTVKELFEFAGGWPDTSVGPAFGFQPERRYTPPAQASSMRQSPRSYPVQVEHDVPSVTAEDQCQVSPPAGHRDFAANARTAVESDGAR